MNRRAEQFRPHPLRILPRPRRSRSRASRPAPFIFREEFTSRIWATGYDFPAIEDGPRQAGDAARRDALRHAGLVLQHCGASKFRDPRVREAIGLAFDFEWTNQNIMFGAYERTASLLRELGHEGEGQAVAGGAGAARAVPRQGAGRGVRRAVRRRRVSDGSGQDRKLLRRGRRAAARSRLQARRQRAAPAERRAASRSSSSTRRRRAAAAHAPYVREYAGCSASRRARASSMPRNTSGASNDFDFDMVSRGATPARRRRATALRADLRVARPRRRQGSRNLAGIADPAVDALIERIVGAPRPARSSTSPAARSTGCCAPGATGCRCGIKAAHWLAYWDMFGRPAPSRNTISARRRSGGSTTTRRSGSGKAVDEALPADESSPVLGQGCTLSRKAAEPSRIALARVKPRP